MWKGGDLAGQGDGFVQGFAFRGYPIGEANLQGFFRVNRTAGENHVHGAAMADQTGQADGAAINQRHPPAPAEYAEGGGVLHHAQIAEQGQFQSSCYRVAGYGGYYRFA